MKDMLKLLLAFAPWLAFWIISGHSMLRLQIAIVVAAVLVVVMGIAKLHRGAILWGGYAFFAFALLSVLWIENEWVIRHLGVLATGTLFAAAQLSIILGRPFTEEYAREKVPRELWESASFIKACYTTTAAWSCVFLLNCLLNVLKLNCHEIPEWCFTLSEWGVLLAAMVFTTLFSKFARKRREVTAGGGLPSQGQ